VIAITRFRVPDAQTETFTASALAVLRGFEACQGHINGHLGRAADDPELWALVTEWEGAGYYRRALGAYDVRVVLIPLSSLAIDEPGAYELVE
jgi:hypothetical protein